MTRFLTAAALALALCAPVAAHADEPSAPTLQDIRATGLACHTLDAYQPKIWAADWDKGEPETMIFCDGAHDSLSHGTGALLLYQNGAWRCGNWENNSACWKLTHPAQDEASEQAKAKAFCANKGWIIEHPVDKDAYADLVAKSEALCAKQH